MSKKSINNMKMYAVCFRLNKKCMTGNIVAFNKRKEAKKYIVDLHKKIGGFEDDHHIVTCLLLIEQN